MRDLLRDLPYFLEVAQHKSFTAAADSLDVPLSTLSRRIAAMEEMLGVSLLHRTTRSMELTESGRIFLESCRTIVAEMDSVKKRLDSVAQNPSGKIRLFLLPDIHAFYIKDVLSTFATRYPDIELHVLFSTRWNDLYGQAIDLEIRVGDLPDSDLKARKLFTEYAAPFAAPSLLEFYPAPETPGDIKNMPCIGQDHVSHQDWKTEKDGRVENLWLRPAHIVNNVEVCLEFVLKGLGIGLFPLRMAAPHVRSGRLVRLLPEWRMPGITLSAVMPEGQIPYRVRLLLDYLVEHFAALQAQSFD